MRRIAGAMLLIVVCGAMAMHAQTPKFTIVSMATDPPGPHPPGSKFKIKVVVRNDGDTIPAGRGFVFIFSTAYALAIGQPSGTPALFFGYCPGSTPHAMACQCFAAWEKGQTAEMETEVTAGGTVSGDTTVTFEVKSGTTSERKDLTITFDPPKPAGPDLVPETEVMHGTYGREPRMREGDKFLIQAFVRNDGTVKSEGEIQGEVLLPFGMSHTSGPRDFIIYGAIDPGKYGDPRPTSLFGVKADFQAFRPTIRVIISGGGDVRLDNNEKTVEFVIEPKIPDPLVRIAEELGRILDGR